MTDIAPPSDLTRAGPPRNPRPIHVDPHIDRWDPSVHAALVRRAMS